MERQRTLTIKLSPDDKTWRRLRELGWQSDQYRNHFAFALTAQAAGLCVDPEKGETNDVTKHIRRFEKGELSGAAYSSAEREVSGFFSRKESTATGKQVSERIKVLAGKALPQWRGGALSIRGHKNKAESGVRLEVEKGNFIIHLQAQAHTCEGGSWIKVVVAGGVEIRDWQAPLLRQMVTWTSSNDTHCFTPPMTPEKHCGPLSDMRRLEIASLLVIGFCLSQEPANS